MAEPYDHTMVETLTARELEILQWIAKGFSDREIGEGLYLTTGTVKWHVKNIYGKLGVHKRTAAVAQGRRLGLIPGESAARSIGNSPSRHRLPADYGDFIGRTTDVASVIAMLSSPECRLISLVGTGGVGKTRLAIHCAHQVTESFPDGVILLALDTHTSSEFLLPSIADVLGITIQDQRQARTQLIHALRQRKLLLILDSFERLLDAAALIAELSANCPESKFMVTSREALNVKEEWIYRLEPLAVPETIETADPQDFGAVRLFMQRANHIRREAISADEMVDVIRICQLIDGLPLAIELITSWLTVMSPREILAEFERIRELPVVSRPDVPERHRTLRAVFEQTWTLLTAEQQFVFMKLSVIKGTFTREAALQIAAAELGILAALVNKSLIAMTPQGRFSIHDVTRQYAEEKLLETANHDRQVRLAHSRYFVERLMTCAEAGLGADVLAELHADIENILAGARYAVAHALVQQVSRYAQGLWYFFEARGWYPADNTLISLYRDAISLLHSHALNAQPDDSQTLLILYESLAALLENRQDYAEARSVYEAVITHHLARESLTSARMYRKIAKMNNAQRSAGPEVQHILQLAESALGDPDAFPSQDWWQEWIEARLERFWWHYVRAENSIIAEMLSHDSPVILKHGTLAQRGRLFNSRMLLDLRQHRFSNLPPATLEYALGALEAAQEANNYSEVPWTTFTVGFVHLWRDEYNAATSYMLKAIELAETMGDLKGTVHTVYAYFPVAHRRYQQVDEVIQWAERGLYASNQANATPYAGAAHAHLGWAWRRQGLLVKAKTSCETAVQVWNTNGSSFPFQWFAAGPLCAIHLVLDQLDEAVACAEIMLSPQEQRLPATVHEPLMQAQAAWHAHDFEAARQALSRFCKAAESLGIV